LTGETVLKLSTPECCVMPSKIDSLEKFAGSLSNWLNWIAGAGLVAMSVLVVADIIAAKSFKWPIPGGIEIVGFLGVIVVAFSIAQTQVLHRHIEVAFLVARLPKTPRKAIGSIVYLFGMVLFVVLAWKSYDFGRMLQASGEVSMTQEIPFSASGMSQRLYDASYSLLGRLRGGLAMATVAGCAAFAAICGSTNATAAAMGRVSLPEMKRYNYADSLATGCVAAAGSLGILIPPSTIFIIYGIMTRQSIGKLFVAGVFPGLILATLFIIVVALLCWRNPNLGPAGQATGWAEKIRGLAGVTETLILFALIIAGLFFGRDS